MLAEKLLHPYHIIPSAELAAAIYKFPYNFETHPLVKIHAAVRKKLIIYLRHGNAGIHIYYALALKSLLKGAI